MTDRSRCTMACISGYLCDWFRLPWTYPANVMRTCDAWLALPSVNMLDGYDDLDKFPYTSSMHLVYAVSIWTIASNLGNSLLLLLEAVSLWFAESDRCHIIRGFRHERSKNSDTVYLLWNYEIQSFDWVQNATLNSAFNMPWKSYTVL